MNARLERTGYPTLLAAATLLALLGSLLAPSPAQAGSSYTYRVSGSSASASWTQVDGTDVGTSPVGNVHVGWLNADGTSRDVAAVFGYIDDWDCEAGQMPGWGHHALDEEPEPEPSGCTWMGSRWIEGYDIPFTFDKKMNTATLKGALTVYGGGHGHDGGGVVGQPMADMVWTGVGEISSGSYTSRWREGGTWYSDSYRGSNRDATMSGRLGPMGFDPDLSEGYLSTFKSTSRARTR